jgi:hypothetical protein
MKNILGSVAFEEISEKTLTCRLHRIVPNTGPEEKLSSRKRQGGDQCIEEVFS